MAELGGVVLTLELYKHWYRLYDVKPTDKLYLAPEQHVKIW